MYGHFKQRGGASVLVRRALNVLYRQPVIEAHDLEKGLKVTTPTANALIKALIDKGILSEITGQQRGRVYAFHRYLGVFVS